MTSKQDFVSKQYCPHTGIVNFFTADDPFISVGSIVQAGSNHQFHWRYYDAPRTIAGIASDMRTAERRIQGYIGKKPVCKNGCSTAGEARE